MTNEDRTKQEIFFDTYLVLQTIPEGARITDFRHHKYTKYMTVHKPEDIDGLPTDDARGFLRDLADVDSEILTCQTRGQLIERLEKIAENAHASVDFGMGTRDELSHHCAIRDNTYQLIDYIKSP